MRGISLDFARQAQPYFIFKRLNLTHYREYFTFQFDFGWNFLLRQFVAKWPEIPATVVFPNVQNPYLNFEFFCTGSIVKARQNTPIAGNQFSVGSRDVAAVAAPDPVDADIFSVCFTATAPKYVKNLNWLYSYRDALRIDITGQNATVLPAYCDIILKGFKIENTDLAVNHG
jgi:hypothetical protein